MAHKKAGGSSRNGRDSAGRRLGVKKSGGQKVKIILSRTHPNFVRKLFEQEVPEIADHTIDIKALASAQSSVRASSSGESPGAGDSSMSFWWLRWTLQSRSPRCTTLP